MKKRVLWVLLSLGLLLTACGEKDTPTISQNQPVEGPKIEIEEVWSRSTPKLAGTGIVYMLLKNRGTEADTLVAGKTPVAQLCELHNTTIDDRGIMRMRHVKGGAIEIPAGETVALEPGGLHVMLVNLEKSLESDSSFPLTLKFEKSGEVTVDVPVIK